MLTAVLTDRDLAIIAPARGAFPVQALVVTPAGWARIDLLPAVTVAAVEGLAPEVVHHALGLVVRHRDAMLAVWSAPPAPLAALVPDSPRASGAVYDATRKALALRLHGGAALTFPAVMIPGLAEAEPASAEDVVIAVAGEVLVWRRLGLFVRVPELVLAVTGGPAWRDRLTTSSIAPWQVPSSRAGDAPARPIAPTPGVVKSLIGLILQREGYLTADDLNAIFKRQMQLKQEGRELTFGQVAIESGLLSPERLQFAVHLQERLAHAMDGSTPLGVFLLESAAVRPSHLLAALEEQKATGRRLGEILLQRELISRAQLEAFLARQQQMRAATGASANPVAPPNPAVPPSAAAPAVAPGSGAETSAPTAAGPVEPPAEEPAAEASVEATPHATAPEQPAAEPAEPEPEAAQPEAPPAEAPPAEAPVAELPLPEGFSDGAAVEPFPDFATPVEAAPADEPFPDLSAPAAEAPPEPEPPHQAAPTPEPEPTPEPAPEPTAQPERAPQPEPAPAPAGPPKIKSLLGIILEREGYLTQDQLRQILAEQERLRASGKATTIGEIALNLNLLTTEQLKFAIGLQKRLAFDAGHGKPLGQLLIENGVAKPSQIQLALNEQARSGAALGEILVEHGVINEGLLQVFLNMQVQTVTSGSPA